MPPHSGLDECSPTDSEVAIARTVPKRLQQVLELPKPVAIRFGAPRDRTADLLVEEQAVANSLAGARRNAFTTGRWLAGECQRDCFGLASAVGRSSDRSPVWPSGCTGSITHTHDLVAAVVAKTGVAVSLGIDLEQRGRVGERVLPRVLTAREHAQLFQREASERRDQATLIFSAKESIYKALHPLLRRYIGFHEVEVLLDPEAHSMTARVLTSGPLQFTAANGEVADTAGLAAQLQRARGYFWQDARHVFTVVAVI
ncbi:MAG: 4'-phosphopantetheinyl transferase family protein [Pseudomonadales bacterium]